MTAQATIITSSKEEAHLIPLAAVRFKPPKMFLWRKKNRTRESFFTESAIQYILKVIGKLLSIKSKQEFQMEDLLKVIRGFEIGNEVITGEIKCKKRKKSAFRFSGR